MNWNSFFPTGYFAWALLVCAIGLAVAVAVYFFVMSAIARRVNHPREKPDKAENDRPPY